MSSTPPTFELPAARPAPVFTLGSALRWLGHDCVCTDRRCWEPVDTLTASMLFLRRGQRFVAFPLETLVLVDLAETGEPLERLRRLIHDVNWCTREQAIQIHHRAAPTTRPRTEPHRDTTGPLSHVSLRPPGGPSAGRDRLTPGSLIGLDEDIAPTARRR
jgi:hypothetical protein